MKRKIGVVLIFLVFISSIAVTYSAMTMGNSAFLRGLSIRPQLNATNTRAGTRQYGYVASVGGIAFQKTATPINGLTVNTIELTYNSGRGDGSRVTCRINGGKEVTVPLYDWELKPIALFADSKYTSCFSLFGDVDAINGNMPTPQEVSEFRKNNKIKHFSSFHPAFKNTLVGLRLMQMDAFYRGEEFAELPTGNHRIFFRRTILGAGEDESNMNKAGVRENVAKLLSVMRSDDYRSYVITDDTDYYSVPIQFSINTDRIEVTGEPFPFFWRAKANREKLRTLMQTYSIRDRYFEPLFRYFDIPSETIDGVENILRQDIEAGVESMESAQNFGKLINEYMTPKNNNFDVVYVRTISEQIVANPSLIRDINPLSYDCTRKVMRFAAFFRYCKIMNRSNWDSFKSNVENLSIDPGFSDFPNVVLEHRPPTPKDTPIWILYVIIGSVVVLLGGIIVVIVVIRKRRVV